MGLDLGGLRALGPVGLNGDKLDREGVLRDPEGRTEEGKG